MHTKETGATRATYETVRYVVKLKKDDNDKPADGNRAEQQPSMKTSND